MLSMFLQRPRNRLRAWMLRRAARRAFRGADPASLQHASPLAPGECRLCGAAKGAQLVLGRPPLTHAAKLQNREYALILCHACEVVYLDPLPSPADLLALYENGSQFANTACADPALARRIVNSYARRLLHLGILPRAGEASLEVGAGPAWVSQVCKQRSREIRTVAQDVSAECASQCPWVDGYVVGPLEQLPPQPFRLVSLTHVIEHLPEPARMLDQLADYVAPGGHAFITAPYRPALWKPRDGFGPWLHYSYLHVPAHISYLSRRWLAYAAAAAGFELIRWDDSHDAHQAFEAVLRRRA